MPETDLILVKELENGDGYKTGFIILNSPDTLNSLTLDMVKTISDQLRNWSNDPYLAAVSIEGAGEKAFCAGGDIRALYESMLRNPGGPNPFSEEFFEQEYRLDYMIHTYPKPVICWVDGIAMGGGVGLVLGSDFKLSTERTGFAMPEIGVGLFPDVGFTSYINKLPKGLALFLMLTATKINAADTQAIGLTDYFLHSSRKQEFDKKLCEINWMKDSLSNVQLISSLLESFKQKEEMSLESEIKPRIKTIKSLMNGVSLLEVSENLLNLNTEDIWMQKAAKGLKQGSPTSAFIIWDQCKRAEELNLKEVFQYELDLAIQVTRHPDFTEGIRAAIIERDNKPQWKYKEIKNVPEEWVIEHLEPAWDVNPLSNL